MHEGFAAYSDTRASGQACSFIPNPNPLIIHWRYRALHMNRVICSVHCSIHVLHANCIGPDHAILYHIMFDVLHSVYSARSVRYSGRCMCTLTMASMGLGLRCSSESESCWPMHHTRAGSIGSCTLGTRSEWQAVGHGPWFRFVIKLDQIEAVSNNNVMSTTMYW